MSCTLCAMTETANQPLQKGHDTRAISCLGNVNKLITFALVAAAQAKEPKGRHTQLAAACLPPTGQPLVPDCVLAASPLSDLHAQVLRHASCHNEECISLFKRLLRQGTEFGQECCDKAASKERLAELQGSSPLGRGLLHVGSRRGLNWLCCRS